MLFTDPSQIYALVAGGVLVALIANRLVLFCIRWFLQLARLLNSRCFRIVQFVRTRTILFLLQHVVYPYIIKRGRFFGPLSPYRLILQLVYWAGTMACGGVRITTWFEAGQRAGTLAAIHYVPLFLGGHLSFAADLLGLSLHTYRRIHSSIGVTAFILSLFHVIILVVHNPQAMFQDPIWRSGFVGAVCLGVLLMLSIPCVRRSCYELFLRVHQVLAICSLVAIWHHLSLLNVFSRFYTLGAGGLSIIILCLEGLICLARSLGLRHSPAEITVTRQGDQISVALILPRAWTIRAGQYVNLIVPGIGFWSFFQSHPLTIAWWTRGPNSSLYFLVQPRRGFTTRLMAIAHAHRHDSEGRRTSHQGDYHRAFFTGPHGRVTELGGYQSILHIATDIGIAAQIPYLKESIENYNSGVTHTRHLFLVWQLETWDNYHFEAEALLNGILKEATKADGLMLHMETWVATGYPFENDPHTEGEHGRMRYRKGRMDLDFIVTEHIKQERGKTLVTVSANSSIRDQVRGTVLRHMDKEIRYLELEFQPPRTAQDQRQAPTMV